MENPSKTLDKGVLKKTLVAEWFISPKLLCQNRVRSDMFSSDTASYCLILISESDLPENMMKFTIWLYTRATAMHTLEVTLSLLDDKNRQCYSVEKRVSNSTSETSKVCASVDFSIIPHHTQKFFHNGALRIQCCVDASERVYTSERPDSGLKPSRDDFNKLEKHLLDIEKAGVLEIKDVFTWTILEIIMKNKVEVRSDPFTSASSKFYLSKLVSEKSKKLNERFEVCLNRETQGLQQKLRVTIAVLDNIGIMHYTKEEITQDSCKVFLSCGKVFEDRGKFLDKGKFKIYCSLQIDNFSKVSDFAVLKPGGSSEPSKRVTVSYPTENYVDFKSTSSELSRVNELTTSPVNKLFSRFVENPTQKLEAENLNILVCSKAEDMSKVEETLNEMFHLIHEAQIDAPFASTIISLLFSTAKDDYKATITKVLLNLVIENNYHNETDLQMISRNMSHISVTEQWSTFMKNEPDRANVIVQRLALGK